MACYGVDTAPVERMSEALKRLDVDLLDLTPNQFLAQARRRRKEFGELVDLYLDMTSCFFAVMRAVAERSLVLERQAVSRSRRERPVDRSYLEGFLPIYDNASERSMHHLRRLLKAAFAGDAVAQAAFVSGIAASGTVAEVQHYAAVVPTASTPAEAQEHGMTGKEITDSIKKFIQGCLNRYVEDKSPVRRYVRKAVNLDVTKEGIEQAFHVINEVIGMFFPGRASR